MSEHPPIRIFLSPPDVGEEERKLLLDAFDSNWIAPLGPHVDAFEREIAEYVGAKHAVALSSGTAGLHLALVDLGVGPGDEVITSTLTFVATANAITYVGATPVFVDVDPETWQMDPALVAEAVDERVAAGKPPAAVITVDLYGQCADHDAIRAICEPHGIPIVEDAAEALGATYKGRHAGTLGDVGIFSFNGNKIITTSGGGMLVTDDTDQANRVRSLATQAREPVSHYEHRHVGYNYRLSNLLAAVGRAQLRGLDTRVAARRSINQRYRRLLGEVPSVSFMPMSRHGESNCWLTCLLISGNESRVIEVERGMRAAGIEARRTWKPMHLQPIYRGAPNLGGRASEDIYRRGVCLPSGSSLTTAQQAAVCEHLRRQLADGADEHAS